MPRFLILVAVAVLAFAGCSKKDECAGDGANLCLLKGVTLQKGSAEHVKQALALYDKVCNGDSTVAHKGCTLAGHIHRRGEKIPKDEAKAVAYYHKACPLDTKQPGQQLAGPACVELGNGYGLGKLGMKKDAEQALRYLNEACKLGETHACEWARMVKRSTGKNALSQVLKRCKAGKAKDCSEAGHRYWKGIRSTDKNLDMAIGYFDKACNLGDNLGCMALGVIYQRGERANPAKMERYLDKACKAGEAAACRELGKAYMLGKAVRKNPRKAAPLLTNACDKNEAQGCMWLAMLYKNGMGVRRDRARAKKLLRKACNGGAKLACKYARR
jgi:TPR repeat protein